ncbi:methylated-DNA--[protein]-cysteine S-methyltransferase [Arthrobacter sp. Ld5]|uniref:methylated-DNA--[protein]-cysteine S-methyltransferase n=1 Tax=Arthrobacter sp. Ld5 TaxID=649152 RepID=UPI003EBA2482
MDTTQHATDRWHRTIPSPVGPLTIVAGTGVIVGLYHEGHSPAPDRTQLGTLIAQGHPREPGAPAGPVVPVAAATVPPAITVDLLGRAGRELGEYFAGSRHTFDIPIEFRGTAFQQRVWAALGTIPYGQTRSYRDIAARLGNPRMGRAIGAAVRSNPVSIIVPGHRVIGSTGAVTGYAAGTGAKTALLELEASHRADRGCVR